MWSFGVKYRPGGAIAVSMRRVGGTRRHWAAVAVRSDAIRQLYRTYVKRDPREQVGPPAGTATCGPAVPQRTRSSARMRSCAAFGRDRPTLVPRSVVQSQSSLVWSGVRTARAKPYRKSSTADWAGLGIAYRSSSEPSVVNTLFPSRSAAPIAHSVMCKSSVIGA